MNDNEKIEFMQSILQYIDANIKNKLNVEKLAEKAGFSPYYFCRAFKWNIGTSIMEYVRNRRLAYAAAELNSGRKIIDIAVEYGFETHSGFSKAFRRYFGCPPEIFRAFAVFNVPPITDLSKANQFISGRVTEPKILVKKPAFKIAGYPIKLDYKNLEKLSITRKEYREDGRLKKLHSEPFVKFHAEYGACFFKNKYGSFASSLEELDQESESVYVIGVEIKPKHRIPSEYNVYTMPETTFAVFSTNTAGNYDDFSSAIEGTWQIIFTEWLPNSGYEFAVNKVAFELFDERSNSSTEKTCDIYFPIVSREL